MRKHPIRIRLAPFNNPAKRDRPGIVSRNAVFRPERRVPVPNRDKPSPCRPGMRSATRREVFPSILLAGPEQVTALSIAFDKRIQPLGCTTG